MTESKKQQGETLAMKQKARSTGRRLVQPMIAGTLFLAAGAMAYTALAGGRPHAIQSEIMTEISSINESLRVAEVEDFVIPLTFHDGNVDLIYTGAPECSHCQTFMNEGFDEMVEYAQHHSLDLVYMPMALSAYGASIAAVEFCALSTSAVQPSDIVRSGYGFVEKYQTASEQANSAADPQSARKIISNLLKELHAKSGSNAGFNEECYGEALQEIPHKMGSFTSAFNLEGTPSFYHTSKSGDVYRTVGFPNLPDSAAARP